MVFLWFSYGFPMLLVGFCQIGSPPDTWPLARPPGGGLEVLEDCRKKHGDLPVCELLNYRVMERDHIHTSPIYIYIW